MKFMITYRTPATYSDNSMYIEAKSEEQAKELFVKTTNGMKYFQDKGFTPKIIKVEKIDN